MDNEIHCPKSKFRKKFFPQNRTFFTLDHLVGNFLKKKKYICYHKILGTKKRELFSQNT